MQQDQGIIRYIVREVAMFAMQIVRKGPFHLSGCVLRSLCSAACAEERMPDEAFTKLYEAYATDVLRVCYFYLNDRQKAEDVTQEVFLRLLTTNPVLQPGKEKAWLLTVAVNRCRDVWRAAWARRVILGAPQLELIPDEDDPDDRIEKKELLQAVHSLPSAFREVVILHYYQGYGVEDIAEMLNVATGTVSSRLSRAREKLKVILKGE